MEENYILHSELIVLLVVWYSLPLLVSITLQLLYWSKIGLLKSNKLAVSGSIVTTCILSPLVGYFSLSLSIPEWLGPIGGMFIMPAAFMVVFIVTVILMVVTYICVTKNLTSGST